MKKKLLYLSKVVIEFLKHWSWLHISNIYSRQMKQFLREC